MRKFKLKTENIEVDVSSWNVSLGYDPIESVLRNNIEQGRFNAKVTIIIEEIPNNGITIESNKPERVEEPEQETDGITEQF